ncbi:MAG TPA: GNAT family N-acetyltransferase [Dissulfurispiraceae bacterium]|nr:GNAT family N-acetyltransferase [Dissulfurispiraceae bacterium]
MNSFALTDGWTAVIYDEWAFPTSVVEAWELFARQHGDHAVFIDYVWFENWWKAFGTPGELFVIVLMKEDVPKGVFPCRMQSDVQGSGEPFLHSLTNDHTCHYAFPIDMGDAVDICEVFVRFMQTHYPNRSMFFDNIAASGPVTTPFAETLRGAGQPFHEYMQPWAPWMELGNDAPALLTNLPGRLRKTIKLCRRKAEKEESFGFEVFRGGGSLDAMLDKMFDVECRNWKGRNGTAIKSDGRVEKFYRGLAHDAAKEGRLLLPICTINDRPAAADYCLLSGQSVFTLKTGYDESFGQFSPSNLLRAEFFTHLIKEKLGTSFHFLGACDAWKMEWTHNTQHYGFIEVFPKSAKGWSQYALKYGMKGYLKKFSAVRALKEVIEQGKEKTHVG